MLRCVCYLAQNEGMTGVISTNGVFSRLTFALYEDSGYVLEWSNNHPRINKYILCNAWNLVASGVVLLLNVFLCTVYLCVLAVPMSVTIWMYICIRTWSFSGTSSPPLCCSSSSWYDVDYSVASPLRFGQCLGCDFAEKSCFSYG